MRDDEVVTIIHPGAEDVADEHAPAPRLASLAGARIGLIDNSKHMADVFLESLGRTLRERHRVGALEVYRKTNQSIPAPRDVIERLVASCDGIVHGVAD